MSKECEDNGALIRCVMLKVKKLISEAGSGIPEAPEDGLQYGRQDGQWTEISGGSQGLNDVLAIDGIAQNKYMSIQDAAFPNDKSTEFLNNLVSVSNSQEGGVQLKPAMIDLYRPLGLGSGTTLGASLKLNNSTNVFSGIYEFPNKGGGTYVLATTDDISLQSMVTNDLNEASKGTSYLSLLSGSGAFINFASAIDNGLTGVDNVSTEIKNTPQQARMKVYSNDAINIDEILVTPLGTQISTENAIGSIVIKTQQPIASGVVNLNFPTKTVAGNYIISTIEDILSLGSLIPTYADNAAAVTGGLTVNKIYKTATGEIRVVV